MKPRIPLSSWVEAFLTERFGNLQVGNEDWREPSASRSLRDYCQLFLPIRCPFSERHRLARQNLTESIAVVGSDGSARVLCQHSSCAGAIAKLNSTLREAQWSAWRAKAIEQAPPILTKEQLELQRSRRDRFWRDKAEGESVLANPVPLDELIKSSPQPVADLSPAGMMSAHLGLFLPEDLVWTADRPTYTRPKDFRRVGELLDDLPLSSVFLAGSTFQSPTGSRRNENLSVTRFVVFEHDDLSKELAVALLRHAESQGMKLGAVVDSGNKSVHGWVVADDGIERWKGFFLANGFCQKTMRATQPARLAGATRRFEDGRADSLQRLLFLNREVVPWLN